MADWNEIKKEYITTKTSYRKLAKKYGVSFQSLQCIALREKWVDKKRQTQDKAETKLIDKVADEKSRVRSNISRVADKLIGKLEDSIDALKVIDGSTIKSYTSALKDLKDISELKSDIDIREQEARIEKLRKDAEGESPENKEVTVIFEGDINNYSK